MCSARIKNGRLIAAPARYVAANAVGRIVSALVQEIPSVYKYAPFAVCCFAVLGDMSPPYSGEGRKIGACRVISFARSA